MLHRDSKGEAYILYTKYNRGAVCIWYIQGFIYVLLLDIFSMFHFFLNMH